MRAITSSDLPRPILHVDLSFHTRKTETSRFAPYESTTDSIPDASYRPIPRYLLVGFHGFRAVNKRYGLDFYRTRRLQWRAERFSWKRTYEAKAIPLLTSRQQVVLFQKKYIILLLKTLSYTKSNALPGTRPSSQRTVFVVATSPLLWTLQARTFSATFLQKRTRWNLKSDIFFEWSD